MNKKTLLVLLGIFIALGITASSSWWVPYFNLNKKQPLNSELDFSKFNESATDKISIIKPGEEDLLLSKENGKWKIGSFVADEKEINDFFAALTSLKIKSLVSKNPDNYENFGIVGENAITLTLTGGDTDTIFIVGNQGSTFSSFYAKTKDGNNVYEMAGPLRDKLLMDISVWRAKDDKKNNGSSEQAADKPLLQKSRQSLDEEK